MADKTCYNRHPRNANSQSCPSDLWSRPLYWQIRACCHNPNICWVDMLMTLCVFLQARLFCRHSLCRHCWVDLWAANSALKCKHWAIWGVSFWLWSKWRRLLAPQCFSHYSCQLGEHKCSAVHPAQSLMCRFRFSIGHARSCRLLCQNWAKEVAWTSLAKPFIRSVFFPKLKLKDFLLSKRNK